MSTRWILTLVSGKVCIMLTCDDDSFIWNFPRSFPMKFPLKFCKTSSWSNIQCEISYESSLEISYEMIHFILWIKFLKKIHMKFHKKFLMKCHTKISRESSQEITHEILLITLMPPSHCRECCLRTNTNWHSLRIAQHRIDSNYFVLVRCHFRISSQPNTNVLKCSKHSY